MDDAKKQEDLTTITGAEIRDFYANHWPADWWHEECEVEIDDEYGELTVAHDAVLPLSKMGYLHNDKGESMSFEEAWKRHKADPNAPIIISISFPAPARDAVIAQFEALGIDGLKIISA